MAFPWNRAVRRILVVLLILTPLFLAGTVRAGSADCAALVGKSPGQYTYSFGYEGLFALVTVDRQTVASWLPAGLVLEAPARFDRGHPVLLLFGTQRDFTRSGILELHPRFGRHYLEAFVVVPHLRAAGGGGEVDGSTAVSYCPIVFVDNATACELGRSLFGWEKFLSTMCAQPGHYAVRCGSTDSRVAVDYTRGRRIERPGENGLVVEIMEMLAQPVMLPHEGRLRPCRLNYHASTARFDEASYAITQCRNLVPGFSFALAPGAEEDISAAAIYYRGCVSTRRKPDSLREVFPPLRAFLW